MAKVCLNCGKKIGMFAEAPLELCDGQVLCDDCSSPIRLKIGKLYSAKHFEEFDSLKTEILHECEKVYSVPVQKAVEVRILDIYEQNVKTQIEQYQTKPESRQLEYENKAATIRFENETIQSESEKQKNDLIKSQMLTTGYDFSGYKIIKYVGIISGEVVLGTGFLSEFSASVSDLFGSSSGAFADKLEAAKKAALDRLIVKSAEKGGNAIIGIDFDYITFSNNMIGVVANGTSVVIEKIE